MPLDLAIVRHVLTAPRESLTPSQKALRAMLFKLQGKAPEQSPNNKAPVMLRTAPPMTLDRFNERRPEPLTARATFTMNAQAILACSLESRVTEPIDRYVATMLCAPFVATKAQGEIEPLPMSSFAAPVPHCVKVKIPDKAPATIALRSNHPAPAPINTSRAVSDYLNQGGEVHLVAPMTRDPETRALFASAKRMTTRLATMRAMLDAIESEPVPAPPLSAPPSHAKSKRHKRKRRRR